MRVYLAAVLCAAVCVVTVAHAAQYVPAQTDTGSVLGYFDQSNNASCFLGIPYAASTAPPNRWQPPQPRKPWAQQLNATEYSFGCPQTHHNPDVPVLQSEDCLRLNVFTPGVLSPGSAPLKPVAVFFHGGGYMEGSSEGPFQIYNGNRMAAHDVVVVTANYRLGSFGWLVVAEGTGGQPGLNGNFGLMDQKAALQWVQRNIKSFGGDPSRVTIWGESAGAGSVGFQLTSPQFSGLYSQAIMESNPISLLARDIDHSAAYGTAFCKYVKCWQDSAAEGEDGTAEDQEAADKDGWCDMSCMQDISTDMVKEAWQHSASIATFLEANWPRVIDGFLQYAPTVDGVWVLDQQITLGQAGKFSQDNVPVMIGTNKGEGETFVYASISIDLPKWISEIAIDVIFGKDGKAVNNFYKNLDPDNGRNYLSQIFTDYLFRCPSEHFATEIAQNDWDRASAPVWVYRFSHILGRVIPPLPAICANVTCHASELPFVFDHDAPTFRFTRAEQQMAARMQVYWSNFIKTGNPNLPVPPVTPWPRWNATQRVSLDIDEQCSYIDSFGLCDWWNKIGYLH